MRTQGGCHDERVCLMRFTLPRPPPPLFWSVFCAEFFGLSRQQIDQWWRALLAAHGRRAVALRESLRCREVLGAVQASSRQFMTTHVTPQVVVTVLEDLIEEGLLPPGAARR